MAFFKCTRTDACHTALNGDGCERRAFIERAFANACYAVRNGDGSERITAVNALSPMLVTLPGKLIVAREVHSLNIRLPMLVIPSGMMTDQH